MLSNSFRSREELEGLFEIRPIRLDEWEEAARTELDCFPAGEACKPEHMRMRIEAASSLFLVAMDREKGRMAGFLNGVATEEDRFRDEFFTDASLHDPRGGTVMLTGLAVREAYRNMGLATELMGRYQETERAKGRSRLVLTCLEDKVAMYEWMGFRDLGLSASQWGGEPWHEMDCLL